MATLGRVQVVDSHTEGEPTRVVVAGGPDLSGSLVEQVAQFRARFDGFRSGVCCEPRGSDAMVGALLCSVPPDEADFGVIFFNNVGYLGMCGHGTIGLVRTLEYLGKIGPGPLRISTPVGVVAAELHADGRVSVANVASYRFLSGVSLEVPGWGPVVGDVAYGGNWFFLVGDHGKTISLENLDELTRFSTAIRETLAARGITGAGGAEIDHIELFGPATAGDSRNFVLCPGLAYDRSPCGTGTSAKLACLAADGKLAPGEIWRQESVIGSVFEGSYALGSEGTIRPTITGRAFITGEATLLFDADDPFAEGIVP